MLICRNAEGVHGERKVGNLWSRSSTGKLTIIIRVHYLNQAYKRQCAGSLPTFSVTAKLQDRWTV